ncbi:uncharacterized protein K452DRAFT_254991 [Aplosporella prunicola CBS 121167]|uniref:Octanoyltransferase n=1 Tax=Aplosporella prunicola CBS 121167 TaxID=1176127 RepID=A0A6A6B4C5_9PEZI|nr:uncharacterized protein K452DRAFT_254991 [Aplosporella prunicola CBS 121167]KAF2138982.1 hypothetical protein K452DRAFT_254991 [Aplosporella prunicola CBS 121167]
MRLGHVHLSSAHKLCSYSAVSLIQDRAVSRYLAAKAQATPTKSTPTTSSPQTLPNPPINAPIKTPNPTVITAEFTPVYTCGRREVGTVSAAQQAHLRCNGRAEFVEALRGGQTTFHGPGQLVAYPVLDLKRHGLTAREYVCLLEKTVIATCAAYGIKAMTTEHTGVWTGPDTKIAALGLHMRRNVTSHGVGLNVGTDLWWFDRIVACGLEGKRATSFEDVGVKGVSVREVAGVFVRKLADALGIEGVDELADAEYLNYVEQPALTE